MSGNRTSVPYTDEEKYQHDKALFIGLMNLILNDDALTSGEMVQILEIAEAAQKRKWQEHFESRTVDKDKAVEWKIGEPITLDDLKRFKE